MSERVLVVDDNRDAADTLIALVAQFGYDVTAVYDGNAAIEQVATFLPDMVLVDIGMPGIDGYETVSRLRKQRGTAHIIIVAVTGWTRPEDKQRAFECGFDLHIAKPIGTDKVREILALLDPALGATERPEVS